MSSVRTCVLLVCCVGLVHGLEYCTSYCDRRGKWHPGFVCGMVIRPPVDTTRGTNTTLYCCGTENFRFCCNDYRSSISGLYPERFHCIRHMSQSWRIVLGVLTAIIILLTCGMCCFFGCSKTQFSATRSRTTSHLTRQDTNNNAPSNRLANREVTEHEAIVLSAGPVQEFIYPIYEPPAYHEIAGDPPPFSDQASTNQTTPNPASATVRVNGQAVAADNNSASNTYVNMNPVNGTVTTPEIPNTSTGNAADRRNGLEQIINDNMRTRPLPGVQNNTGNVSTDTAKDTAPSSSAEPKSGLNHKQQLNNSNIPIVSRGESSTVTNVTLSVQQGARVNVSAAVNLQDNINGASPCQTNEGSSDHVKASKERKTVSFDNAAFQADNK